MISLFCSCDSATLRFPTRTPITSGRMKTWIGSTARSNRFKSNKNSLNSRSINFWRSLQLGMEITNTSLRSTVYGFSTVPSPLISTISGRCGDPIHRIHSARPTHSQSFRRRCRFQIEQIDISHRVLVVISAFHRF